MQRTMSQIVCQQPAREQPALLYCYANSGETWRSVDSEKLPSQAAGVLALLDGKEERRSVMNPKVEEQRTEIRVG